MVRRRNSSLVARGSPSPKWIATIVESLVIQLTNAPKPKKDKYKKKYKGKKDDSSDDDDEKKKNKPYKKKDGKKKEYHKKKNVKAYCW